MSCTCSETIFMIYCFCSSGLTYISEYDRYFVAFSAAIPAYSGTLLAGGYMTAPPI